MILPTPLMNTGIIATLIRVRNIVNHSTYTLRYDSLKEQLTHHYQEITVQNYLNLSNRTHAFDQWLNQNIQLDWVKAEVVKDAPDKIQAEPKEQHLNFQMVKRPDIDSKC